MLETMVIGGLIISICLIWIALKAEQEGVTFALPMAIAASITITFILPVIIYTGYLNAMNAASP